MHGDDAATGLAPGRHLDGGLVEVGRRGAGLGRPHVEAHHEHSGTPGVVARPLGRVPAGPYRPVDAAEDGVEARCGRRRPRPGLVGENRRAPGGRRSRDEHDLDGAARLVVGHAERLGRVVEREAVGDEGPGDLGWAASRAAASSDSRTPSWRPRPIDPTQVISLTRVADPGDGQDPGGHPEHHDPAAGADELAHRASADSVPAASITTSYSPLGATGHRAGRPRPAGGRWRASSGDLVVAEVGVPTLRRAGRWRRRRRRPRAGPGSISARRTPCHATLRRLDEAGVLDVEAVGQRHEGVRGHEHAVGQAAVAGDADVEAVRRCSAGSTPSGTGCRRRRTRWARPRSRRRRPSRRTRGRARTAGPRRAGSAGRCRRCCRRRRRAPRRRSWARALGLGHVGSTSTARRRTSAHLAWDDLRQGPPIVPHVKELTKSGRLA